MSRLRILVLGYFVRWPIGGMAWHYLQYVLGLASLGHDVYFVEDSDDYDSCWNPEKGVMERDPSFGLAFTVRTFERVGLADRWAYYDETRAAWLGPAAGRMPELARTADLVLDVSGVNRLRDEVLHAPVRALIDTDPVFTQIRILTEPDARRAAERHNRFFTFGENTRALPADGLDWRPTRQPVALDAWPVTPGPRGGEFRTVLQWDSYAVREHQGRQYGMKSRSFEQYEGLPARTNQRLGLAATRLPADRRRGLEAAGWRLHDPDAVSRDPWTYQRFLQESKGEFTVAKHGYVAGRSGWFSERSAAFLASGRPVITQDTGFRGHIAADAGLVAFATPDEALAGLERVAADYPRHCAAAREVAAECFDAARVLAKLVDDCFTTCREASS